MLLQFSPSLSDFDCVSPVRTRLTREAHSRGSLERLTREAHLRGLGAVTVISATAILSFAIRLRLRFSILHPAHSRSSFEGSVLLQFSPSLSDFGCVSPVCTRLTREAHSRGSLERLTREAHLRGSFERLARLAHSTGSLDRPSREFHSRRSREMLTREAHSIGPVESLTREAHARGSLERLVREARSRGSLKRLTRAAHSRDSPERQQPEAEITNPMSKVCSTFACRLVSVLVSIDHHQRSFTFIIERSLHHPCFALSLLCTTLVLYYPCFTC